MSDSTHVIAWDGIELEVPKVWNLSAYSFEKGIARIELEADYSIRAWIVWTRPRRPVEPQTLRERSTPFVTAWRRQAVSSATVEMDLPGWQAELFRLPDREQRVMAWAQPPAASPLLVWIALGFDDRDAEAPGPTIRRIARSFRLQSGPSRRWSVYDMSIELPADFRLITTSLQAGRKMLVFQRRLRRLFVWQFSLAQLTLQGESPARWCARFLNSSRDLRGPRFRAEKERLVATHPWWRPLGHADEIGRWCFRYATRIELDRDADRLRLWVYQHRRASDLEWWA